MPQVCRTYGRGDRRESGVCVKAKQVVQTFAFAALGDLGVGCKCATDTHRTVKLSAGHGLHLSCQTLSLRWFDTLYRLLPALGLVNRIPHTIRRAHRSNGRLVRGDRRRVGIR